MLPVPLRRDRFTTEVGPDDSGSKPGIEGCNHVPEISGLDAPLSLPRLADPRVGAAARKRGGRGCCQCHHQREIPGCTFMTTSCEPSLVFVFVLFLRCW